MSPSALPIVSHYAAEGGFQREVQHHEAFETDRLSRIALENLMGSELLALDRIARPAKKLKALNSAGVALRAGTQDRVGNLVSIHYRAIGFYQMPS